MSVQLSQGTQCAIAKTYGSVLTMSAITNASEAVATLSDASTIAVNDIIEITSGWGRLNRRIVRVKAKTSNDITLEGIDTSSTTLYPAGSGTGSVREITAWDQVTQVGEFSADVPSVDTEDVTFMEDQVKTEIPTLENAVKISATVFYDPSAAWKPTVLAASDTNALAALRMIVPSGGKIYANAYWKMSRFPAVSRGQAIRNGLNISIAGLSTDYVS